MEIDTKTTVQEHFTFAPVPIGDIIIGVQDKTATLCIEDDITPLEAANLAVLMAVGAVQSTSNMDWLGYIKDKRLERHFIIKEKDNA